MNECSRSLSALAVFARIPVQIAIKPPALLWVKQRRPSWLLLLGPRLLLPRWLRKSWGCQLEVTGLAALDRAQLARVDHKDLTALLPHPAQKGKALGVVRHAMIVAAQKEGTLPGVIAMPGHAAIHLLPAGLALVWRPVSPAVPRACQDG